MGCEAKGISNEVAKKVWGPELTTFFSINNQVSSSKAEKELGWKPQANISMLEDIAHGSYHSKNTGARIQEPESGLEKEYSGRMKTDADTKL